MRRLPFLSILIFAMAGTAACVDSDFLKKDKEGSNPSAPASYTTSQSEGLISATGDESGAGSAVVEGGSLNGTRVDAPSGSLPTGSTLVIGALIDPEDQPQIEGLVKFNDPVHVSLTDSEGQPLHEVTQPLTIALNLPSAEGQALNLNATELAYENLCILLDASDGTSFVWTRNTLKLNSELNQVQFQSSKLGTFQLADCSTAVVDTIYGDASAAGIAGKLQLLLSMTVQPQDFTPVKPYFCIYTLDAKGNPIDGFHIPTPSKAFTAHLVSEPDLYPADATFSVHARFTVDPCKLAKDSLSGPAVNTSKVFGGFSFSGEDLTASPVTGILGDANGAFPMTKVSYVLNDKGLLAHAERGCLVRAGSNATVQNFASLAIANGKLNDSTTPFAFWTTDAPGQLISSQLHIGVTCEAALKGRKSSKRVLFPEVNPGATLAINVLPLALNYYADIQTYVAAAPGDPDVPVCVVGYSTSGNATEALGSWRFTAIAPAEQVGANEDPMSQEVVAYFGADSVASHYELDVTLGTACIDGTDVGKFSIPAASDQFTAIDFE